ncbi:ribose-phosphate diphosphokinase [Entamoeba marina]
MIMHTKQSKYMADLLVRSLKYPKLPVIRKIFTDGEKYYKIEVDNNMSLVGRDIIIVSSVVDDNELLELVRLGLQLADMGTRRRIFIIPYLIYQTLNRASLPGEIVTCKTTIRMLSTIHAGGLGNIFMLMDLHNSGIIHYFEQTQAMELYTEQPLANAIKKHVNFKEGNVVFGTTDLGRPKWVETYSNLFGVGIVLCRSPREVSEQAMDIMEKPIGDVKGKHVIIYDDMIRSGKTLVAAANNYISHGAVKITAVVSHFASTKKTVVERLENSCLDSIIITNTHVNSQLLEVKNSKKIIVVDISEVFVRQIVAIEGENLVPTSSPFHPSMLSQH